MDIHELKTTVVTASPLYSGHCKAVDEDLERSAERKVDSGLQTQLEEG